MTALSEFTLDELTALVETMGEPKYRAKQLMRHIVAFDSYDEYTDITKALIEKLKSQYTDRAVREKTRVTAADGAVRYLFELTDGDLAEAVFLPHEYGNSVCVSCQVGCAMGCVFCASGYYGLKRNLSAGEILAQALYIVRDKKAEGVNKIVMMGSGSPLANYDNTVKFVRLITAKDGLNIGMRSISVSTCGLPDKIERLAYIGGKSDWIDLRAAEEVTMKAGEFRLIPLGIAMELPKGYEAHVVPRSSTFKSFGIIQTNSMGVIDETYCGDNDQWFMPAYALRDTRIHVNDRICQFRIMEHQPELFFEETDALLNGDRGGFGSTGKA